MAVQKLCTTRGWVVRELLNQSHDLQVNGSSVPNEAQARIREFRKARANFGFGTLDPSPSPASATALNTRRRTIEPGDVPGVARALNRVHRGRGVEPAHALVADWGRKRGLARPSACRLRPQQPLAERQARALLRTRGGRGRRLRGAGLASRGWSVTGRRASAGAGRRVPARRGVRAG